MGSMQLATLQLTWHFACVHHVATALSCNVFGVFCVLCGPASPAPMPLADYGCSASIFAGWGHENDSGAQWAV
eukprot:m.54403 g.54403  ORF g.54403 m.54403 type:complete len:73 (+) comp15510_c0_seq1:1699-1917(+)